MLSATTTSIADHRKPGESHATTSSANIATGVVAIHQPNFLPNIAFFRKIVCSSQFIILDDVQYRRRGYINRNRILTPQGVQWVTVPVLTKGKYDALICDIQPQWDDSWHRAHLRTFQHCYRRAPFYQEVVETVLAPAYDTAREARASLATMNTALIKRIGSYLGIDTTMHLSSTFAVTSRSTARLVDLVRSVGGAVYLSGSTGRKYMKPELFEQAGIRVRFNDAPIVRYAQFGRDFVGGLSIVDALFHCGHDARKLLLGDGTA